jgi:hypothetical protein
VTLNRIAASVQSRSGSKAAVTSGTPNLSGFRPAATCRSEPLPRKVFKPAGMSSLYAPNDEPKYLTRPKAALLTKTAATNTLERVLRELLLCCPAALQR